MWKKLILKSKLEDVDESLLRKKKYSFPLSLFLDLFFLSISLSVIFSVIYECLSFRISLSFHILSAKRLKISFSLFSPISLPTTYHFICWYNFVKKRTFIK